MDRFKGKKILILGGASQHVKFVEIANKMGIYTIVTDYIKNSPAKIICDKAYHYDVKDIHQIIQMCKQEKVDGIITGYLDPCQVPYSIICKEMGFPSFGTETQFLKLTNKHAFKKVCTDSGVDVVPEFSTLDVLNGDIKFPVYIKPVDSRGSRGQTICHSKEEIKSAIAFAQKESSNNDILIEKYMQNCNEFQVTYFFIKGKAYLIRTADSYCGQFHEKMNKVVLCSLSPSKYTDLYIETVNDKIINMLEKIGIENGPVFMQGFHNKGKFYFFDPGLRFPGVDYELILKKEFGVDLIKSMIIFSLTGDFLPLEIPDDCVKLNQKIAAILFPVLNAGEILSITGAEKVIHDPSVISYTQRYHENDNVLWTYDVNQRFAEIDILVDDIKQFENKVSNIQMALHVKDKANHAEMLKWANFERIIASRLNKPL